MHMPARRHLTRALALCSSIVLAGALVACGEAGSSGTEKPDANVTGKGCAPVAGEKLVVLADDKKLQTVDNVVPAITADKATPELIAALDQVSESLDTEKLIELNRAVDVERQGSQEVAEAFARKAGIGKGLKKSSGTITIGSANFSESKTIGSIYAYALRAAGFEVIMRTVGNRELYEPALENGDIHVVPEYVGTLTEFLNQKVNGKGADPLASSDLDATMKALTDLGGEVGLKFGKPSAAADQNAFAVTAAFAAKHGVKTLSEFAEKCSGKATVLAGSPECPKRPFCKPGLEKTYGLMVGEFKSLDAGGPQTKKALRGGEATIGLVLSSDAELA